MRRLDRLHLRVSLAGSRMLRGLLARGKIGRRHVKTAMRRMGIAALSPSAHHQTRAQPQDPSISAARHGDYATNQVWAMEITYILGRLASSISLWCRTAQHVAVCRADCRSPWTSLLRRTLAYALARPGKPDIFNAAQGSQFTGHAITGLPGDNAIAISMDGTAHGETTCLSNGSGGASTRRCARYDSGQPGAEPDRPMSAFYDREPPHSGHGGSAQDQACFTPLPLRMAA